MMNATLRDALNRGMVIPACPLALDAQRRWDERRQRALVRYYLDAGAGGIAVAVHTTQFAIREARHGLFQPIVRLVAEEMARFDAASSRLSLRVGGICGDTTQAVAEAVTLRETGYHAGLLNLGAARATSDDGLVAHCRRVAEVIPLFGFYLSPSVGGRLLPFSFWRKLGEVENLVAVKIAAFNRYQTLDVVRAMVEEGRDDVALYTGNDDNIVLDLLTPMTFLCSDRQVERRIVGGLLGQWAVGTHAAVAMLKDCHRLVAAGGTLPLEILNTHVELTDVNAAMFDAANGFKGVVPGVHEVLRRHGLFEGTWCLDPNETLSPGQLAELDRVWHAYPHLFDVNYVRENIDRWMA